MPTRSPELSVGSATMPASTDCDERNSGDIPSLIDVALFYSAHLPAIVRHRPNAIMDCFRQAKVFQEIAARAVSGELWSELEEDPFYALLDDAFSPNLPADHPVNMISKSRGSIDGIKQVLAWGANPHLAPEKYQKAVVGMAENLRKKIPQHLLKQLTS